MFDAYSVYKLLVTSTKETSIYYNQNRWERVEKNALLCTVAADLNVGSSTVSDCMKGKEKLTKFSVKPIVAS